MPDLTDRFDRFDRFDEATEVLIALLANSATTFSGCYVSLRDAFCSPKPVQRPHPPITIGGRGPRRTLRSVARFAQAWNVITQTPDEWSALKQVLVGHCEQMGRDAAEIHCSVNVRVESSDDTRAAIDKAAAYRNAGVEEVVFNLPLDCGPDILSRLANRCEPLMS